jgi:plasmid stabilization system protein ParE
MTLTLSPRAIREAERCARWWYEHRPAARLLFDEELRHALDQIRSLPHLGHVFKSLRLRRARERIA